MLRNMLIYFGLVILSLVGISFYGGPVSYGFLFFLIGIFIASRIHILYQKSNYRIYQELGTKNVVCNKPISYFFTIGNESHLGFSSIGVSFFYGNSSIYGLSENNNYQLNPHTKVSVSSEIVCKYRGEYQIGIKEIEIVDFLRIFKVRYKNKERLKIMVYPQIVILDSLKSIYENNSIREREIGKSRLDMLVREYEPGDDMRRIHWSQTAKSGKLMTRKTIDDEQQYISLFMDSTKYSNDPKIYLPLENKIMEVSIALTRYFTGKGIPVMSFYHSTEVNSYLVSGLDNFDNYYSTMCHFFFSSSTSLSQIASKLKNSNSFFSSQMSIFVVHELNEELLSLVQSMNSHNIPVMVYVITDSSIEYPQIPNTSFLQIEVECDIKEVL